MVNCATRSVMLRGGGGGATTTAAAASAGGLLALLALFGGGVHRSLGTATLQRHTGQNRFHTKHQMGASSVVYVPTHSDAGDGIGARKTTFSSRRSDGNALALTHREVVRLWRESSGFRDVFIGNLQEERFNAFFWETPPITRDTMDQMYEHVVKNAPNLDGVQPEPEVFGEHLRKAAACGGAGASVATFLNLGGDATLVAPCENKELRKSDGAHFATFLRG
jgi:hypothetical protein